MPDKFFKKRNTPSAENPIVESGERYFKRTTEINPDYEGTHYNLGVTRLLQKDIVGALDAFLEALAKHPGHIPSLYNVGNIHYQFKQYYNSVRYYNEVLSLDPKHEQAAYNLALCYENVKDWARAKVSWEKYLQLHTGSSFREKAEEHLRKIKDYLT